MQATAEAALKKLVPFNLEELEKVQFFQTIVNSMKNMAVIIYLEYVRIWQSSYSI